MSRHRLPALSLFLMLGLVLAFPPALLADRTPGIEIDGNYEDDDPADPFEDWYPNHPPTADPVGNEDDTLCATSPAPKNDISNSYAANDNDFLFTGMERLANTGQTSFFWSFDIGKDGATKGDFIFVFCFGSGEKVTDTYVLEYDDTLGQFVRDTTPPDVLFAVNTERTFAPYGALDRHGRERRFIDPGKFAEASIDLDDIEGFDICDAAAVTLEIETKSSCSLNSQCKDTTGEIDFSFFPLVTALEVTQPDPCEPVLIASANARDGQPPYSYRWFLDGEEITDRDPTYATSDTIVIPLEEDVCGPTEVAVAVDDGQCTREEAATVDVNQGPQPAIAQLAVGDCDLTLDYDATATTDCNESDSLTFAWDFDGDLIPDSTDPAGSHVYPSCGERAVTLAVADAAGCLAEPLTNPVYVNEPPRAGLRVEGGDCLEILFASTTLDCDLLQSSGLYTESLETTIDFGDGASTTEEAGVHEYPTCGTYPMLLTATDAKGCTDEEDRRVTIETVIQVD